MLSIGVRLKSIILGSIEVDEIYIKAELKSKSSSAKIKFIGRKPRREAESMCSGRCMDR